MYFFNTGLTLLRVGRTTCQKLRSWDRKIRPTELQTNTRLSNNPERERVCVCAYLKRKKSKPLQQASKPASARGRRQQSPLHNRALPWSATKIGNARPSRPPNREPSRTPHQLLHNPAGPPT